MPPARRSAPEFPLPYTTVDIVIFTVRESELQVLLVKRPADSREPFPGRWALPGGFVNIDVDADLHACARRKLLDKTGVVSPYLEQLGSWGSRDRDPRGHAGLRYDGATPHREVSRRLHRAWSETPGRPARRSRRW